MNDTTIRPAGDGRALKLKAATTTTHDRLDRQIMAERPFESLARYGLFLQVQHQFHRDIDALYDSSLLQTLLPDLPGRRRLGLIEQDLADLGMPVPDADTPARFSADTA